MSQVLAEVLAVQPVPQVQLVTLALLLTQVLLALLDQQVQVVPQVRHLLEPQVPQVPQVQLQP